MGLWDVLSGKVYRDNRLMSTTLEGTAERLEALHVEGLLNAWGRAISLSSEHATRLIVQHKDHVAWRIVTRPLDPIKIRRLAAFLAWFITERMLEQYPSLYENPDAQDDETSNRNIADLRCVTQAVYPPDDVVHAEIAAAHEADLVLVSADHESAEWYRAYHRAPEAVDNILGVAEAAPDVRPRLTVSFGCFDIAR